MSGLDGRHLVVFMTHGVSVSDWARIGMLDRELAIYRRLVAEGMRVTLMSSGGAAELEHLGRLGPIELCCNHRGLPLAAYRLALPWLHRRQLGRVDVIKTNQTAGGLLARHAARRWGAALVARCGYMWSVFHRRRYGDRDRRTRLALRTEQKLFASADLVQVTADFMRDELSERFAGRLDAKVRVVPNYVETQRLNPASVGDESADFDVLFVGRFGREKNVDVLLEAVKELPIVVGLAGGGGATPAELRKISDGGRAEIRWLGQVPHAELPATLNRAKVFVLPSRYEGHPKALIEAMACGRAVIVSDRPGLREVVVHRETGLVVSPTPEQLREAIRLLLGDIELRQSLGRGARAVAVERYSLDHVAPLEAAVLREAMSVGKR